MADAEEVRRQIRSAFPPVRFSAAVTRCDCDECNEISRNLRGKTWDAIDDETMESEWGSLALLTDEAFSALLPAWLVRSIENLEAEQRIREWTLYGLALYHSVNDVPDELPGRVDRLRRRSEQLSPEQVAAVRAFLMLMRDRAQISQWDRESIDRALELVWRR